VTLNLAVSRSRPPDLYGANLLLTFVNQDLLPRYLQHCTVGVNVHLYAVVEQFEQFDCLHVKVLEPLMFLTRRPRM